VAAGESADARQRQAPLGHRNTEVRPDHFLPDGGFDQFDVVEALQDPQRFGGVRRHHR
jgi:hypothetical protein